MEQRTPTEEEQLKISEIVDKYLDRHINGSISREWSEAEIFVEGEDKEFIRKVNTKEGDYREGDEKTMVSIVVNSGEKRNTIKTYGLISDEERLVGVYTKYPSDYEGYRAVLVFHYKRQFAKLNPHDVYGTSSIRHFMAVVDFLIDFEECSMKKVKKANKD